MNTRKHFYSGQGKHDRDKDHASHDHKGDKDHTSDQHHSGHGQEHGTHSGHDHHGHGGHSHHEHHLAMVNDFKFRFWWVLALTIPILALSPMIQGFLGVDWRFPGDIYLLFALSIVVYFFGGRPFLTGLAAELKQKQPGMMTLIGLAITVAFVYSAFVVVGLEGHLLFWELSTLVAIMLLGHWIEMRSVMSASDALEKLAELLPGMAHRFKEDGSVEDVPVEELNVGDRIIIKPGEKIPSDGLVV